MVSGLGSARAFAWNPTLNTNSKKLSLFSYDSTSSHELALTEISLAVFLFNKIMVNHNYYLNNWLTIWVIILLNFCSSVAATISIDTATSLILLCFSYVKNLVLINFCYLCSIIASAKLSFEQLSSLLSLYLKAYIIKLAGWGHELLLKLCKLSLFFKSK